MNKREIYDLKSDFHNAFALELANILDTLISGYTFKWGQNNLCLKIKKTFCERHHRISIFVSINGTQCELCCFNYYAKHIITYELSDPTNTVNSIGLKIFNILEKHNHAIKSGNRLYLADAVITTYVE